MRFLVDANLSPRVAAHLREHGHEATHVADHGLLLASDEVILRHAAEIDCSIISADRLSPDEQAALLVANLPPLVKDLEAGSVVSISMRHLRVRPLPIR